jgi:6-phosphogluconate dehydrogenase
MVVAYDRDPGLTDVADLRELVDGLAPPRLVWVMLPAGAPTDETLDLLTGRLAPGDLVVDGGNANLRTSVAHGATLADRGIEFADVGVSGGVWGRATGYGLMVGGSQTAVDRLAPVLDALRSPDGSWSHAGPVGSGHFAKMIHNGSECGMMQALGEGVELLQAGGPDGVDVPAVLHG